MKFFHGAFLRNLNSGEEHSLPNLDPVNAMLSFGYSLLFGNCCVSVIGADSIPDLGFLNEGRGSLVLDLIEPLKSKMIDAVVFDYAREFLKGVGL